MNKIFISGNLTRDPEVRYTQSGKAVAKMGIAVKRIFSKENEVDFFNIYTRLERGSRLQN